MDKLEQRKAITSALQYPMQSSNSDMLNVQSQLIVDEAKGSFAMFLFGWYRNKYVHTLMFHIEPKEGQVWIYQNNTDYFIDEALMNEGIAEENIIAAWETPYELESTNLVAQQT